MTWADERKYEKRIDFVTLDSVDGQVLDDTPEFLDYLYFHNVIDKFCWLIKFQYSDRITVKKKKYRIDTLFQNYVYLNKYKTKKAAKCLSKSVSSEKIEYHLSKGWLNELVRSVPLHPDYLEIGTMLSSWDGPGSEGLTSWNIVQSYYAFYEYICSIGVTIDNDLDTRGHLGVSNTFSNKIIGKSNGRILFYPFNLTTRTPKSYIPEHPRHCQYHYATYPRELGRGITDLEDEVQKAFKVLSNKGRKSIFDLLYEFRLWANYTGIQSLMKLSDGGYQKFLVRNLATLVYFSGGMAELAAISALGESEYKILLKKFSKAFIDKHEQFARNKFLIPAYIRLRSYKHLGLIDGKIDFIIPESSDPVKFIDV